MDNFKLYKKWFWVGIAIGFLNVLGGLIYGIALLMEPDHRREGLVIIAWSVLSFILWAYVILPALPEFGV